MLSVTKVTHFSKAILVTGTFVRPTPNRFALVGTLVTTRGSQSTIDRGRTLSRALQENTEIARGVWGVVFENDSTLPAPNRRVFEFQLYNSAGRAVGNAVKHTETDPGSIVPESISVFEPADDSTVETTFATYGSRGNYAVIGAKIIYPNSSEKLPAIDPPFDDPFSQIWYTEFYDAPTTSGTPATLRIWDEATPPNVQEVRIHIA